MSKKLTTTVLSAFAILSGCASLTTASLLQPPPAQAQSNATASLKLCLTCKVEPFVVKGKLPCFICDLFPALLSPTEIIEQEVYRQINAHRASLGLSKLVWNETIVAQARQHSKNMANKQVPFGHDGLSNRITATKLPYSRYGENVVYNRGYDDPATKAVQLWLNSPGHRANIERAGYNLTGIGAFKNAQGEVFFTQIFLQSP